MAKIIQIDKNILESHYYRVFISFNFFDLKGFDFKHDFKDTHLLIARAKAYDFYNKIVSDFLEVGKWKESEYKATLMLIEIEDDGTKNRINLVKNDRPVIAGMQQEVSIIYQLYKINIHPESDFWKDI